METKITEDLRSVYPLFYSCLFNVPVLNHPAASKCVTGLRRHQDVPLATAAAVIQRNDLIWKRNQANVMEFIDKQRLICFSQRRRGVQPEARVPALARRGSVAGTLTARSLLRAACKIRCRSSFMCRPACLGFQPPAYTPPSLLTCRITRQHLCSLQRWFGS